MSESENAVQFRVNDRRRFDPDGNPRQPEGGAEEAPAAADREASGTAPQSAAPEEGEPSAQAAAGEPKVDELEMLKQNLEAAYRRIDELARAIQAGEREREAFKSRLLRERERMLEVEKGNIAQVLLEAVDELDLCLANADDSPLAQGVRMIRDGMLARLGSLGVERVPMEGQPFDPNVAEAVDMEVTDVPEDDQKVVRELRAAYRLNDRVIREGRVKVAKYVPPASA